MQGKKKKSKSYDYSKKNKKSSRKMQPSMAAPSMLPSDMPLMFPSDTPLMLPSNMPSLSPTSCYIVSIYLEQECIPFDPNNFHFTGLPLIPLGSTIAIITFMRDDVSTGYSSVEHFSIHILDDTSIYLGQNPSNLDDNRDRCHSYDCCENMQTFSVAGMDFNSYIADGQVIIQAQGNSGVDKLSCGSLCKIVRVGIAYQACA